MHATSTFIVTAMDNTDFDPEIETALTTGHAILRKRISGQIEGYSVAAFSSSFDPQAGLGIYVALESFTGTVAGRGGTFNFAHSAETSPEGGRGDAWFKIVTGSGTEDLAGIRGTGDIVIDPDGTHHLELEYDFG